METTLRMVFGTTAGRNITIALPCADATASSSSVLAAMNQIISSGIIGAEWDRPVEIVGAEFISRQVTQIVG